jgi:hypothetical protein
MPDRLQTARQLAEMVRFSGDALRSNSDGHKSSTEHVRSHFSQVGLQVTPSVTPSLATSLDRVCERLHIPEGTVDAFVHSSPSIQAECYAGSSTDCVIQFSSGLIDLLDGDEVEFVAGHEIGHFLLRHGIATIDSHRDNIEFFMQQRSQEISVDRIGLLACRSLDTAIRAMMKTVSGLTSKHLRFDVGTFVAQLRNVGDLDPNHAITSSHPSILVRCRALLWFSLNDFYTRGEGHFSRNELQKIDKYVEGDLTKFVDGPARKQIEEAKENLAFWMAAYDGVQNGVFSRTKQANIASMFGEATLNKLLRFIEGLARANVEEEILSRMQAARQELERVIPNTFETEYGKIEARLGMVGDESYGLKR